METPFKKHLVKGGLATWLRSMKNRKLASDHINEARKASGRLINEPVSIHLARLSGVCSAAAAVPVFAWRRVAADVGIDLDEWVFAQQQAKEGQKSHNKEGVDWARIEADIAHFLDTLKREVSTCSRDVQIEFNITIMNNKSPWTD